MSVVCFASLKGGVGKTSLSMNVSHAFARRGCQTLVIDLDPSGHTTRLFRNSCRDAVIPDQSQLARYFLGQEWGTQADADLELSQILWKVREDLSLLPGGEELRHFLWGRGHQIFAKRFQALIDELKVDFDHVIIDTPPDFNTLTRNALASADIAVVPVDASEMSIYSLEELILSAQHIRRPIWSIVRTMVNRKAQRSQQLSSNRLHERLDLTGGPVENDRMEDEDAIECNVEDPQEFMRMLQTWEQIHPRSQAIARRVDDRRPIFLLRSLIYRTEKQNQLTFGGKTAFDTRAQAALGEQYVSVAREIESILATREEFDDFSGGTPRSENSGEFGHSLSGGDAEEHREAQQYSAAAGL